MRSDEEIHQRVAQRFNAAGNHIFAAVRIIKRAEFVVVHGGVAGFFEIVGTHPVFLAVEGVGPAEFIPAVLKSIAVDENPVGELPEFG